MAVFTPVAPQELGAWLKNYSIGSLIEMRGVASGIENTNYFVTTTHGRYVLTLFEKLTRAELPFYIHLLAHLARHGIPCPAPIADRDNEYMSMLNGKPAAIVTRLPGVSIMSPGPDECASIGAMLADLHVAGESYGRRLENPRGLRWWRETAPQVMPFLPVDERIMLEEEISFLALFQYEDLPRGVVHADLFRDNVLFDEGRIGGIIDFYFAGNDALLLDVAITVNDWCSNHAGALDLPRALALLKAYHSVRPFTTMERRAWQVLLRAAALRFWLSRLHDLHLPRPGELVHPKDPNLYRDILRSRIDSPCELPGG